MKTQTLGPFILHLVVTSFNLIKINITERNWSYLSTIHYMLLNFTKAKSSRNTWVKPLNVIRFFIPHKLLKIIYIHFTKFPMHLPLTYASGFILSYKAALTPRWCDPSPATSGKRPQLNVLSPFYMIQKWSYIYTNKALYMTVYWPVKWLPVNSKSSSWSQCFSESVLSGVALANSKFAKCQSRIWRSLEDK